MTEAQLARLNNDWGLTAGEPIEIQQIGGAIYAFGSELATLRLFRKFNSHKAHQDYSKNMGTFYFRLDV